MKWMEEEFMNSQRDAKPHNTHIHHFAINHEMTLGLQLKKREEKYSICQQCTTQSIPTTTRQTPA